MFASTWLINIYLSYDFDLDLSNKHMYWLTRWHALDAAILASTS